MTERHAVPQQPPRSMFTSINCLSTTTIRASSAINWLNKNWLGNNVPCQQKNWLGNNAPDLGEADDSAKTDSAKKLTRQKRASSSQTLTQQKQAKRLVYVYSTFPVWIMIQRHAVPQQPPRSMFTSTNLSTTTINDRSKYVVDSRVSCRVHDSALWYHATCSASTSKARGGFMIRLLS